MFVVLCWELPVPVIPEAASAALAARLCGQLMAGSLGGRGTPYPPGLPWEVFAFLADMLKQRVLSLCLSGSSVGFVPLLRWLSYRCLNFLGCCSPEQTQSETLVVFPACLPSWLLLPLDFHSSGPTACCRDPSPAEPFCLPPTDI